MSFRCLNYFKFKMERQRHREALFGHRQLDAFPCHLLLKLFPFAILISPNMTLSGAGEKIVELTKHKGHIMGHPVTQHFRLRRPKGIAFTWKNVSVILAS